DRDPPQMRATDQPCCGVADVADPQQEEDGGALSHGTPADAQASRSPRRTRHEPSRLLPDARPWPGPASDHAPQRTAPRAAFRPGLLAVRVRGSRLTSDPPRGPAVRRALSPIGETCSRTT